MKTITINFDTENVSETTVTENGNTCGLSETCAKDAETLEEIKEAFQEEADAKGEEITFV